MNQTIELKTSISREDVMDYVNSLSYASILKEIGVFYLSAVSSSQKTYHSELMGYYQTGLYLTPWDASGRNVCPKGQHCHTMCLDGSGHNRVEIMSGRSHIQTSRLRKTDAFFKNKPHFIAGLIKEIIRHKNAASRKGHQHFVRLNCTSDISPLAFKVMGKNLLELFPDTMFVDYTKVPNRCELLKRYPNYDLTFSYDGRNWDDCLKAIRKGVRVAVVGDCEMPKAFDGLEVVNGDLSDIRFLDPKGVVVWLKYKRTANDFKDGKYQVPDDPFVVKAGDPRLAY